MQRVSPTPPPGSNGCINKAFQDNHSDYPESSEKGPPNSQPQTSSQTRNIDTQSGEIASQFNQLFQLKFKDPNLERTFKNYVLRSRHNMATFTFILGLSLNVSGIITEALADSSASEYYLVVISLCVAFNILALSLLAIAYFTKKDFSMSAILWLLFIWSVFLTQLFGANMAFGSLPITPESDVMWITCMCYYSFVLYPMRMRYSLILNLIMFIIHCVMITTVPLSRSYMNVFQYGKLVSIFFNSRTKIHFHWQI